MTTTKSAEESRITVGQTQVELFSGGSGPPLLFLHGAGGNGGWMPYHEALAQSHTVYVPSQPGFNGTQRPGWLRTITDLAHFNIELAHRLGLDRYTLMGSSMGGWVAAEMAAMCQHDLKGLILVDAVGIRPKNGEITEIFMVSAQTRQNLRFHDASQVPDYDELYARELTPEEATMAHSNQEMASRLCWNPYMHNPSLPYYLEKVATPTLIVWGREDAIVPLDCGELYQRALPNATLRVIDHCGHSPALEKPQEFLSAVREFLSGLK